MVDAREGLSSNPCHSTVVGLLCASLALFFLACWITSSGLNLESAPLQLHWRKQRRVVDSNVAHRPDGAMWFRRVKWCPVVILFPLHCHRYQPPLIMNRLFGSRNAKAKPGLTEAIASTEARADGVEVKIRKLDGELGRYRDQMKKMRDGPGKVRSAHDGGSL